ncbi:hypothetical protein X975_06182, partial [Stegodyphus mimosarum]
MSLDSKAVSFHFCHYRELEVAILRLPVALVAISQTSDPVLLNGQ